MKATTLSFLLGGAATLIATPGAQAGFLGITVSAVDNPFGFFALRVYAVFDRPGQDEMLAVAGRKGAYSALHHGRLGDALNFVDDQFAATGAIGVFSPGHAEPDAFVELIRVTRPGGVVAFSIRHDTDGETGFAAAAEALETEGRWSLVEKTRPYQTMPLGEPEVLHQMLVYRVR